MLINYSVSLKSHIHTTLPPWSGFDLDEIFKNVGNNGKGRQKNAMRKKKQLRWLHISDLKLPEFDKLVVSGGKARSLCLRMARLL